MEEIKKIIKYMYLKYEERHRDVTERERNGEGQSLRDIEGGK